MPCLRRWFTAPLRTCSSHITSGARFAQGGRRRSSNIATILQHPPSGEATTKTICGTVRSVRRQKSVAFAAIGDGSTLEPLQAVLTPEQATSLSNGVAVKITGLWQSSPSGKQQSFELQAKEVEILGQNDAVTYPIQKKYQTLEYLRNLPHLRVRTPHNALLLHLRSQVIAQVSSYFETEGFVQTHPPIITSSDCEGAGEVFSVSTSTTNGPAVASNESTSQQSSGSQHFFRSPKFLTVSAQLHLEALAQAVGKVWCLSPTFRAEKSDTPRHLSEFYMLEAELSYIHDLNQVMDVVEDMLRYVASTLRDSRIVQELCQVRCDQMDLRSRWEGLIKKPWVRITYAEAVKELQKATDEGLASFEFNPQLGSSLQAEHEKYLADHLGQGSPIFITDYPRAVKPFYMAPSASGTTAGESPDTVACFDLLAPEVCELVGGSLREHRSSQLLDAMKQNGLFRDMELSSDTAQDLQSDGLSPPGGTLQWYTDLRRYGGVPHGGFGLGFDRLLGYLSGTSNIRDVVTFPRWYGRCEC